MMHLTWRALALYRTVTPSACPPHAVLRPQMMHLTWRAWRNYLGNLVDLTSFALFVVLFGMVRIPVKRRLVGEGEGC